MNKKGFTLMELLAVTIVLGIIVLIAVPSISKILDKGKKDILFTTANNLVETTKQYYYNKILDDNELSSSISLSVTDSANMSLLDFKGKLPENGYILIDASGNIGLAVTQGNYCAKKELWSNQVVVSSGVNCEITDFEQMEEINNSCFILNSNKDTITGYKITDSNCPKDIIIPAEIGGRKIVAIGDGAFAGDGQLVGKFANSMQSSPYVDIIENSSIYTYGPLDLFVINADIVTTKRCYYKNSSSYDVMPIGYKITKSDPYSGCNVGDNLIDNNPESVMADFYAPVNISNNFTLVKNSDNLKNSVSLLKNDSPASNITVQQIADIEDPLVESYGITSVNFNLATNLTSIGVGAFLNNKLTSLTFTASNMNITNLGAGAFQNNLVNGILDLSNLQNLKKLNSGIFYGNSITNVILPNGLENIGLGTFTGNSISSIIFPTSIKKIDDIAFSGNNLELLDLSVLSNLTFIGQEAFGDNILSTIKVPNSVTSIGEDAFQRNSSSIIINIDKEYNALEGSPWGATGATVIWLQAEKYSITYSGSDVSIDNSCLLEGKYFSNCNVILNAVESDKTVISFKVNGASVLGNSFEMPTNDVTITDVVLGNYSILESNHPYSVDLDQVYTKTITGATKINVEFSLDTYLEDECDYIYITDALGAQIGQLNYTNSSLAGQSFIINGDTVNIRLVTDFSVNEYGFFAKISMVE